MVEWMYSRPWPEMGAKYQHFVVSGTGSDGGAGGRIKEAEEELPRIHSQGLCSPRQEIQNSRQAMREADVTGKQNQDSRTPGCPDTSRTLGEVCWVCSSRGGSVSPWHLRVTDTVAQPHGCSLHVWAPRRPSACGES